MLHDDTQNGHSDPLADTVGVEPLEWPEPRRRLSFLSRGWRIMTGRPSRREDSETAPRRDAMLQRWGWAITFVVLQTGTLIWWASRQTTIVEQHTKELAVIERVKDENLKLRADVDAGNRQRTELSQYVEELNMWCGEVRTKIITTGAIRERDLPPLPKRNGRGY